jgi:uncharacterized protein
MKFTVTAFLCLSLFASKAQDFRAFQAILDPPVKRVYTEAKNNTNEVQIAFSGLFLFYKTFVSSQDLSVCTFTPSCSEYGILAVKRFGPVQGGFMTMDRLTRCNGLSPTAYEIDRKTQLLSDPPLPPDPYRAVEIR